MVESISPTRDKLLAETGRSRIAGPSGRVHLGSPLPQTLEGKENKRKCEHAREMLRQREKKIQEHTPQRPRLFQEHMAAAEGEEGVEAES